VTIASAAAGAEMNHSDVIPRDIGAGRLRVTNPPVLPRRCTALLSLGPLPLGGRVDATRRGALPRVIRSQNIGTS